MVAPTYIDTTIEEGDVLNQLADLLKEYGWTHEKYFKKTVFPASFINPMSPNMPQSNITFGVAEHMILRHPDPDVKVLYGFALYGSFSLQYGMLPDDLKPMTLVPPAEKEHDATVYKAKDGNYAPLAEWVTNKYPKVRENHTIYVYMCNTVSDDLPENGDICMAAQDDLKRAALDIEVMQTAYYILAGSPAFKVIKAMQDYKQSPIQQMSIRIPQYDGTNTSLSYLTPFEQTNWHDDSLIRVRGITNGAVGKDHYAFLMLQADASAAYEDNATPLTPLFIGKFEAYDPDDKWNFALMIGTAFPEYTPEYDFDAVKWVRPAMQPLLKNYIMNPSNGADTIMVYRNKYGAYYQSHHLFVSAPSNIMPPIRTHEKRDYPAAWKRPESHVHNYQYNPGTYTDEVPSSYAEIEHQHDGVRGKFPNVVVTMPFRLNTGDRLKRRVETCDNKYDIYRYFLVEAVSPFTKIAGTPYRQLGIGLKISESVEIRPPQTQQGGD